MQLSIRIPPEFYRPAKKIKQLNCYDLWCLKVGGDETYLFFFEVAEKKRGSLICSLLHRGQRLGARKVLLLVKVNPHVKQAEAFITRLPFKDLCTCSRWLYTSFSGMCMA